MTSQRLFLTAAVLLTFAVRLWADDTIQPVQPAPEPAELLQPADDMSNADADADADTDADMIADADADGSISNPNLVFEDVPYEPSLAVRLGWWTVEHDGSPTKVGEWQGLDDSLFWDIDGIHSDGYRTLDFSLNGTENENTDLDLYFFGPNLEAEIDYDRFIHRYPFKPIDFFTDPDPAQVPARLNGSDMTETMDHAIRVQEVNAKFGGHLTENVKWKLNVWGMQKFGQRQRLCLDHGHEETPGSCGTCHEDSVTQNINWTTMEIEPGIEAKFGALSVEYTRTMRTLQQDDEVVSRMFTHGPVPNPVDTTHEFPYGVVSENFTQIDRLKVGADLTENTHLYSVVYHGGTDNRKRDTTRDFWGVDLRVTNRTFDDFTITGYAKHHEETNQVPTTFPEEPYFNAGAEPSVSVRHPVDREVTDLGVRTRWTPFGGYGFYDVGITGGYKYQMLRRQYVTYEIGNVPSLFTQPDTYSHIFDIGADWRCSEAVDMYARYRWVNNELPMFGVRESDNTVTDPVVVVGETANITALNTNQPRHVHRVDLGGTWTPSDNFLLSAMIGIEERDHQSTAASFDEKDYPMVLSAWYAPDERWSFTGGMAFYSNWIDQDITFGQADAARVDTRRVQYGGWAQVYNLGARYQCSETLALRGEFEYVKGKDTWSVDGPAGADWSMLPGYSSVIVNKTRFTAGADYFFNDNIGAFFEYVYYDYDDVADAYNTGLAHMFLVGISGVY